MNNTTENQTKHEPGPWITHGDLIGTAKCDWWHEGNELVIAKALRYGGTRPTDANARLIAAAPELLEACKSAVPFLKDHVSLTIHDGPSDRIALDKIEAAIAKAEGNLQP